MRAPGFLFMGSHWDERYREASGPTAPAALLTSLESLLPKRGKALDLACGAGRNSVWLAERGLEVVGIDLSGEALRQARELASQRGCQVTWLCENVETYPLGSKLYDAIVCFYFRSPTLYPRISKALRPGGWLVYETYTLEQLQLSTGPRNPDHLLRPGELLEAFRDLEVVYYRETQAERAVASLVARKSAVAVI